MLHSSQCFIVVNTCEHKWSHRVSRIPHDITRLTSLKGRMSTHSAHSIDLHREQQQWLQRDMMRHGTAMSSQHMPAQERIADQPANTNAAYPPLSPSWGCNVPTVAKSCHGMSQERACPTHFQIFSRFIRYL